MAVMPSENNDTTRLMRVAQTAETAGVSKQTLQYYLMVGLVDATDRTEGGQQLFDERTVERIRLIKRLNDSGYPLREIRDIFLRGGTP